MMSFPAPPSFLPESYSDVCFSAYHFAPIFLYCNELKQNGYLMREVKHKLIGIGIMCSNVVDF